MLARAPLPKAVNAVGDRIGLNYRIDRKSATSEYIETNKDSTRLEFDQIKHTRYSLSESKTVKEGGDTPKKSQWKNRVRNPLKLNSRARKQLYKLTQEDKKKLRYSLFEKINELWKQYSQRIICDKDQMSLLRMDLHGCKLKCTASKNPTLIGAEGIVVQETKNTFQIIQSTNRLVTLPKKESLFEFKVGDNTYRIHGCNLLFTTQMRTKVKYKQKRHTSDI